MKGRFAFLQYCIDPNKELPDNAKSIDWMEMMAWAEKQAVVGGYYLVHDERREKAQAFHRYLKESCGEKPFVETVKRMIQSNK